MKIGMASHGALCQEQEGCGSCPRLPCDWLYARTEVPGCQLLLCRRPLSVPGRKTGPHGRRQCGARTAGHHVNNLGPSVPGERAGGDAMRVTSEYNTASVICPVECSVQATEGGVESAEGLAGGGVQCCTQDEALTARTRAATGENKSILASAGLKWGLGDWAKRTRLSARLGSLARAKRMARHKGSGGGLEWH